jgi:hypothetical protein
MRKNGNLASTLGEENGGQGTDVTLAVAEIRKEYSTKLEEVVRLISNFMIVLKCKVR